MAYDSTLIVYSGVTTPIIPITAGQNLQTILQNIDTAINAHSAAPNYSSFNYGPYNGYTIYQTDGVTTPTTAQNFTEGIGKIVCNLEYTVNHFIGTTYSNNLSVLSNAIANLQNPGLAYSSNAGGLAFTITAGMSSVAIYNTIFSAIGTVGTLLGTPGTAWSSLSITTPTNISDAFNDIIVYLQGVATSLSGKQATLATINNSSNILSSVGGTSTDSVNTTTGLLTTYITHNLTSYLASSITTWGAITTGTTMQNSIQYIVDATNYLYTNGVVAGGTGLSLSSVGTTYQGKKLAVDFTNQSFYKILVDSSDTTSDFLNAKITSGTGISTAIQNVGGNENVQITNTLPETYKVKVTSGDTVADYISNKIQSTGGTWGLGNIVYTTTVGSNTFLAISPQIPNPEIFISNLIAYISTDPAMLAAFSALVLQSQSTPNCNAGTSFTVTAASPFTLAWTHGSGCTSQTVNYRQRGSSNWVNNINITAANPQTNTTNSASVANLNNNTVWQFQVTSNCSGSTNNTPVVESILFACQNVTKGVICGVITINQAPLTTVDNVTYLLYSGSSLLQTVITTGLVPSATFTSVSSGTYTVKWRMSATVNGVTVNSDDSSQLNALCTTSVTV